jgi:hypothetical protein
MLGFIPYGMMEKLFVLNPNIPILELPNISIDWMSIIDTPDIMK